MNLGRDGQRLPLRIPLKEVRRGETSRVDVERGDQENVLGNPSEANMQHLGRIKFFII
jgi:hypothetical protein